MVVPFAAGTGSDLSCRIHTKSAADDLRQSIIIDNRSGGAGTVGVRYVINAAPDGYTLLCLGGGSVSKTFRKDLDFDMLTDLAPVIQITRGAM